MAIEHKFEFDPTNGKTKDELLAIQPGVPPEGFEKFWRDHYRQVVTHKPDYTVEAELWSPRDNEKSTGCGFAITTAWNLLCSLPGRKIPAAVWWWGRATETPELHT